VFRQRLPYVERVDRQGVLRVRWKGNCGEAVLDLSALDGLGFANQVRDALAADGYDARLLAQAAQFLGGGHLVFLCFGRAVTGAAGNFQSAKR
jgi:hypothetical protein